MGIETLSEHRCFGGVQGFYRHDSAEIGLPMKFGVYLPPQAAQGPVPVLFFLAGLTCNEETFAIKAGAQRYAAELGLAIVTPDTSPRDTGIEGADASWDFGHGAGFYLDATQEPWAKHFRMESWITKELHDLVLSNFSTRPDRVGICGHSMGGHGALTLALRHPGLYQSVSAIAPICAPSQCPWGEKAFAGYLGLGRAVWAEHDAVELIKSGPPLPPLLVDQGLADKFLADQLHLHLLEQACADAGQPLELHWLEGFDHGYYFIASVIERHLVNHASRLS
ncbi:MAG: S-formylglutathione hydrolase [Hydrogenophaga sp.]|uniref:S-formylglutathione hydrolase n=1 Tax=Hydrogenophaga sp. TaxID=1904254 RepID=UPI0025BA5168|nr:S-formylglutathione hydrolase [Hydrogenophaga sp.]MDO9506225.1 S-formylglutathione hydrolase [Hydrogenophaga sp.]MDP3252404.1 S-formylglutathione hydrolase [Hydrogenophaga sp.]MDP3625958.1 S-formylglutathione hydrolase [Hydrogenophaga sp.]